MKKILLILISNIIFAQSIPEPREIVLVPPDYNLENDRINEDIKEALKPFILTKKYGIGIVSYQATDDNYTTGANFSIFNPSSKTIKYIWFTVAGENPVGDLVKTKTGYYKTLKGIGPIAPNNIGEWSFDYVWLTDVVESMKISTIKIQYMDGSFKTIKYNDHIYIGYSAYEKAIKALNKDLIKEKEPNTKIFPPVSNDDQTVFSEAEFSAEFPGGISALRKSFGDYFDTSQMIGQTGRLETELSFIIEKDGSISNVTAIGNNEVFNREAIRTIKAVRYKWSPARIKTVKVRSSFKSKFSVNIE